MDRVLKLIEQLATGLKKVFPTSVYRTSAVFSDCLQYKCLLFKREAGQLGFATCQFVLAGAGVPPLPSGLYAFVKERV